MLEEQKKEQKITRIAPIWLDKENDGNNWWDVTLVVTVKDGKPVHVEVAEVKQSA